MASGLRKKVRRACGYDEVALISDAAAISFEEADLSWRIGEHKFSIPGVALATDRVIDPDLAIFLGHLGDLAILSLEGLPNAINESRLMALQHETITTRRQDITFRT